MCVYLIHMQAHFAVLSQMQAAHRDFLFFLETGGMCEFWSHEDFDIVFIDPRHVVNFSLQRND